VNTPSDLALCGGTILVITVLFVAVEAWAAWSRKGRKDR
jgi:hypothetical protein